MTREKVSMEEERTLARQRIGRGDIATALDGLVAAAKREAYERAAAHVEKHGGTALMAASIRLMGGAE